MTEPRYFFIRRPVLAAVISIVITLLGVFAIRLLPVVALSADHAARDSGTAVYPGATAEDVAEAVAAPIEQQLSGLQGMLYYSSANSSDGTMNLADLLRRVPQPGPGGGRRAERREAGRAAASRRGAAERHHHRQGQHRHPGRRRRSTSSDPRYDAHVSHQLHEALRRGRDQARPGRRQRARRSAALRVLHAAPARSGPMAQLGITVGDVPTAVREQNATNPAGRLGREPAPPGTQLTMPVTTLGRLQTPEQFDDIIVRAKPDGSLVRLRDIGRAKLGGAELRPRGPAQRQRPRRSCCCTCAPAPTRWRCAPRSRNGWMSSRGTSRPACPTRFRSTRRRSSPPRSTRWCDTLVEAMLLVALVVFVFLQSWRATLIPMLAVPVVVIGTFLGLLAARLHRSTC